MLAIQLQGNADAERVPELVEQILQSAQQHNATDIHLIPRESSLEMNWRINGVLHFVSHFPQVLKANIVSRLKVLADLLTYHTDVPQEGRIQNREDGFEVRVSTFPSLFGEKAVIRLFVGSGDYRTLSSLDYPGQVLDPLIQNLFETSGVILLTRFFRIRKNDDSVCLLAGRLPKDSPIRRAISTLEDPIEAVISAASQSQIRPSLRFRLWSRAQNRYCVKIPK